MYNQNSVGGYSVADGVDGRLMGKTLGYLVLLLAIVMVGSVIGVTMGSWGLWGGFILAIAGTIMVSRRMQSASKALGWGILTAIGLGMVISSVLWYAILYQGPMLMTTIGALLLALLLSAAVVAWVPWDFSKLGPILFIGLVILVISGLLSFILPSMTGLVMSNVYNVAGVVIFTGYLMVDFSIMRYRGRTFPSDGLAVVLAVSLLVDIVNLFLFLLRLGRR
ncbi:MAG: Bax inhibitor-1 family protein [Sulfobacillus sp.]